ncbi:MAG TPA: ubiquinol oxidase subunit II, partial [Dyella sp.]|nr:ubiquinol oxidase subunit II [Dyella sp.]
YKVWTQSQALDPYRPIAATAVTAAAAAPAPLEVQVVGLDWKWLFIYPDQHIAALNTLVLPVGRPVHLRLTSDTVMESLLMPQLAGQIYAMPGMTTQLWLRADRPGDYLGENTQYNGSGFAKQSFVAHAVSAGEFDRWVEQARAHGDDVLDARRYGQISERSVPPAPLLFGQVDAGLFERIVAKYHGTAHAPTAGAVMQTTAEQETLRAH